MLKKKNGPGKIELCSKKWSHDNPNVLKIFGHGKIGFTRNPIGTLCALRGSRHTYETNQATHCTVEELYLIDGQLWDFCNRVFVNVNTVNEALLDNGRVVLGNLGE